MKLSDIRTIRRKAVKAPWTIDEDRGPKYVKVRYGAMTCCSTLVCSASKESVAEFIAKAPGLIDQLLLYVEQAAKLLENNPDAQEFLNKIR
jgi:hypothetical protein